MAGIPYSSRERSLLGPGELSDCGRVAGPKQKQQRMKYQALSRNRQRQINGARSRPQRRKIRTGQLEKGTNPSVDFTVGENKF
jgi:hypothetical protein